MKHFIKIWFISCNSLHISTWWNDVNSWTTLHHEWKEDNMWECAVFILPFYQMQKIHNTHEHTFISAMGLLPSYFLLSNLLSFYSSKIPLPSTWLTSHISPPHCPRNPHWVHHPTIHNKSIPTLCFNDEFLILIILFSLNFISLPPFETKHFAVISFLLL